jgi:hypothetical protein
VPDRPRRRTATRPRPRSPSPHPTGTRGGRPKYKSTADEPNSSFECKLKGKGLDQLVRQFNECDSPRKYEGLDEGKFKFKVRAIDEAGNVDPSPAKDKFKIVG